MKTLLWLDDVRNPSQNDWLNFSPIGKENINNLLINFNKNV